jgi:hypothetical protein
MQNLHIRGKKNPSFNNIIINIYKNKSFWKDKIRDLKDDKMFGLTHLRSSIGINTCKTVLFGKAY